MRCCDTEEMVHFILNMRKCGIVEDEVCNDKTLSFLIFIEEKKEFTREVGEGRDKAE